MVLCSTAGISASAAATAVRLPLRRTSVSTSRHLGAHGKMDKCTFCQGGPGKGSKEEQYAKYGQNRIAAGKLPLCAEMCSTKALLARRRRRHRQHFPRACRRAWQGFRSDRLGHGVWHAQGQLVPATAPEGKK